VTDICSAVRWSVRVAAIGLAALAASPLAAQTATQERTVKAQSGREVRVAVFASMKPDCTPGRLPTVRLKDTPKNGTVTVKQGRLRATNIKQCLAAEVPAFIAVYRSSPSFEGSDELTLEVINADGKTQLQHIRITVEKPAVGQLL
jgi:hypothetical protein